MAAAPWQVAAAKFRNAGQVCVSSTRVLVQEELCDRFLNHFIGAARAIRVGDGLTKGTTMASRVGAGTMISNYLGLALPKVAFGGIEDSGYRLETG